MNGARHILHHDLETRSRTDLKVVGAAKYAADPSTEILCLALAVDDEPVQLWMPGNPVPAEFVEAANNPNWITAAHNDHFERSIATHILQPKHGFRKIPLERRRCSMAMAYAAALPGALEKAIAALGLPYEKDKTGQALMRRMSKPRRDGSWIEDAASLKRLGEYCRHDVDSERALFKGLPPLTPDEQKLWELDAIVNDRGFAVDAELLDAARRVVVEAGVRLQAEFRGITGLNSASQVEKFIAWLAANDCVVTDVQKGTLRHALKRKHLADPVRRAIELRLQLAHASAGKVDALRAWRGNDNRVRGTLKYHGAATGRWAGHGPQPQNFKRDSEDTDAKIAAVTNGGAKLASPFETIGGLARAMICAAPKCHLIIGDFSGIESRVLAWISGQQSKLERWARFDHTSAVDDDPYVLIGRSFGHPNEKARAAGKIGDLAFGFGGGVGAWKNFAPEDDESDEVAIKRYRDKWRAEHPESVKFWYALDRAAINAVQHPGAEHRVRQLKFCFDQPFLRIALPSSRSLSYPFPRIELNRFGHQCVMFKDTGARNGWGDCNFGKGAYGGTWCENVVSGIARDLLAAAIVRLEAAGYPVVLHVHDEVVCEAPIDFGRLEEFEHLITTLPEWAEGLPVAAKVRNGQRFAKSESAAAPASSPDSASAELNDSLDDLLNGATDSPEHSDTGDPKITNERASNEVDLEAEHPESNEDSANPRPGAESEDGANDDEIYAHGGGEDGYANGEQPSGSQAAAYIYRAADGTPYLRVLRTTTKQFPQWYWDNGRWIKGKPKGPKIPYRLPELIAAVPDVPVFICEGEKDTDNVAALDLIATTNSEGAGKGKWTVDLNKWFAGKRTVYILEDNDEDGRRHAREVAGHLQHLVDEIRIVSFRDMPLKGDVSDWLAHKGGTKEKLLERAKAARKWERDGYVLVRASDIVPRAMDWLWQGHILRGSQELLTGIPGGGKSQIHCAFVSYVTTGGAWPDGCNGAPAGNVIMLTAEDCLDQTIVPRLIAAGADRSRVFVLKKIRKDNKERMFLLSEDLEELERMIGKVGDVRLITIDPITAYMGHKLDSHRATDVRGQLGPLADLAELMDVALSAITHPPKHTSQRAIDHFIGSQAFIAAARIGHMTVEEVSEDEHGNRTPTGRSLFTNPKNNVSRKMSTLAYRIEEKAIEGGIKAACVTWEEIVDITADQAIAATAPSKNKDASGIQIFLFTILANGPVAVKLIEERAGAHGFSKDQLKRAKQKLEIVAFRERGKFDGGWFWALPQHAPTNNDDDRS
jgi:DNA polymerase bacteriophage-type